MPKSRLKYWIHIVVGLACAVGSLACAMTALHRAEEVKRFRADEEIKNLGVLKQQDERDATFRLINATEKAVEVIRNMAFARSTTIATGVSHPAA
jgi:hypothetical protein